jgi:hypothetical protein
MEISFNYTPYLSVKAGLVACAPNQSLEILRMSNKKRADDIAGGQALIEGVMMRHENKIASAVRRPDNEIIIQEKYHVPLAKRYKILGFKFIRGSVSLI